MPKEKKDKRIKENARFVIDVSKRNNYKTIGNLEEKEREIDQLVEVINKNFPNL